MGRISDDQRGQVIQLVKEGKGRNEISRATGVSAGSVSNIAQHEGLSITPAGVDRSLLNNLLDAARVYDRERRLRLFYRSMERAEEMLADPALTPRGLQAVVLSQAVATDKVAHLLGEAKVAPQPTTNIVVMVGDNGRGPSPEQAARRAAEQLVVEVSGRVLPAESNERTGQ